MFEVQKEQEVTAKGCLASSGCLEWKCVEICLGAGKQHQLQEPLPAEPPVDVLEQTDTRACCLEFFPDTLCSRILKK